VHDFPFRSHRDGYLVWIGRLNDDKGPQRAIAAARCRERKGERFDIARVCSTVLTFAPTGGIRQDGSEICPLGRVRA
jgi:hypothetical protein